MKYSVERRITPSANSHGIIIDSGIDGKHDELRNNIAPAEQHKSFVKTDFDSIYDCAEHDTHSLSGKLHSIKVFD